MANTASAKKAARQMARRTVINKARRSRLRNYVGKVEDRALVVEGKRAVNPSSAANIITGNNVNGWRFWEAVFPDNRTGADSTSFERELLRSDFPRSVSLA